MHNFFLSSVVILKRGPLGNRISKRFYNNRAFSELISGTIGSGFYMQDYLTKCKPIIPLHKYASLLRGNWGGLPFISVGAAVSNMHEVNSLWSSFYARSEGRAKREEHLREIWLSFLTVSGLFFPIMLLLLYFLMSVDYFWSHSNLTVYLFSTFSCYMIWLEGKSYCWWFPQIKSI